eukprot:COSAG02_NODE_152_length_33208_cov_13.316591_27_plen_74_part_00
MGMIRVDSFCYVGRCLMVRRCVLLLLVLLSRVVSFGDPIESICDRVWVSELRLVATITACVDTGHKGLMPGVN